MITINFYNNGAYIIGHDRMELCTLVSYAMNTCINDCLSETNEIEHFESARHEEYKRLGLSFVKILDNNKEAVKIFNRFREGLTFWIDYNLENQIKIINHDECIEWTVALNDAKREQGLI